MLKSLYEVLVNEGYNVIGASNGKNALALVRSRQPAAVILDIVMPKLNGMHVVKTIKKEFPAIKVIMLTAYGNLGSAVECWALGADDFIEKSYEIDDLIASLNYVLKGSFL